MKGDKQVQCQSQEMMKYSVNEGHKHEYTKTIAIAKVMQMQTQFIAELMTICSKPDATRLRWQAGMREEDKAVPSIM